MDSLETLKQELLLQKSAIEQKGGNVVVLNSNPSPSEITAGIKSIEKTNFALATATEEDVLAGKTFYATNEILKTGTMSAGISEDDIKAMYLYPYNTVTSENQYKVTLPNTEVKPYMFYNNANNVNITFNESTTDVGTYAFYKCNNFTFENLNNLTLTQTGVSAFEGCYNVDWENLPKINKFGNRSFCDSCKTPVGLVIPESSYFGTYVFASIEERKFLNYFNATNFTGTTFPNYLFYQLSFDCDFIVPENVTTFGVNCFYRGSFKNITFHDGVTLVNNSCFGSLDTDALDTYHLETVTFLGTKPPKFGTNVFATQNLENGLKIYVPDTAVDTYKTASNFTIYADYIYPISEKA